MSQKNNHKQWLKFSQIGIQMAVTISIFCYLGLKVDEYFEKIKPFGVAFLSLFGIFVSFYLIFKELKSINLEDEN